MNLSGKSAVVAALLLVVAVFAYVGFAADTAPKTSTATAKTDVKATEPNTKAEKKEVFADNMEKVSYAIGFFNGSSFKRDSVDIRVDAFVKGLKDGMSGNGLISEDEMRTALMAFGQEMRTKAAEKLKVQGEENKKKGEEFLKANETKEGVKKTASGLQYKVITEGTGAVPKATDTVKVHYKGTLIDGKEFDSSYKRGEPVEFPVNGVIAGWTEALQLMKVGSKYQLFIPTALAYGENAPPSIGPNQVLIFDVELLDIVKPEAAGQAGQPAVEGKAEVKPADTKEAGKK
jgi:FKBP-type peptidyl-prolyl cis-trans isomerase